MSINLEKIKCIFFDVGYTLVNEDEVWRRRCEEQAETREALSLGLSPKDIYNEIIVAAQSFRPQYKSVIKKFNFREIAPYRHEFEKLYEDAEGVLFELSKKYKLGIIANQSKGLKDRLNSFGIDKYFNYVISSSDFSLAKPEIRFFEMALKQSGYLAGEAIMVGDRLDNDIAPAKTIGMKTVWIKQGFGAYQKPNDEIYIADIEINCLSELMDLL